MNLHGIIIAIIVTIILSNAAGFCIRLAQERFSFVIFIKALFLFPVFFTFSLLLPFIIPFYVLRQDVLQNYNKFIRGFVFFLAIPMSFIYTLGNFSDIIDQTIIKSLRNDEEKRQAQEIFKSTRLRVFGMAFAQTTVSLSDRVSHAAIFSRI